MCRAGESGALGLAFVPWDNPAVPSSRSAPRPRPETARHAGISLRRLSPSTVSAGRRGDTSPQPLSWLSDPPVPAHTPASGPNPWEPPARSSACADMRPIKPGAPLPALLVLALALSLPGAQGRPRGGRGARATDQEPKSWLFLPAARAGPAPNAFRSTGKQSPSQPVLCSDEGFRKAELSRAEDRPSLQITGSQEKR